MTNREIKLTAAGAGVKLWQIAEEMGIADCSLSRKLRKELSDGEKERILDIIDKLSGGRGKHERGAFSENRGCRADHRPVGILHSERVPGRNCAARQERECLLRQHPRASAAVGSGKR